MRILYFFAALNVNFSDAADTLDISDGINQVGKCGSTEASCIDEISLVQMGLRVKNSSLGVIQSAQRRARKEAVCIDSYRHELDKIRPGLGSFLQPSSFQVSKTSEKPLIIGAGFGSTGTHSLWTALDMFHKNASHCGIHPNPCIEHVTFKQLRDSKCDVPAVTRFMNTEPEHENTEYEKMTAQEIERCLKELSIFDYTSIPNNIDAILDTPVAEVFLYLWRSFPNAKVILTRRNASDWVEDRYTSHDGGKFMYAPMQNPCGQRLHQFTRKETEQLFDLHSELVQCLVPKDQLFQMNMFDMDDLRQKFMMQEISAFLNITVPNVSQMQFPNCR